ncbi:SAGA complex component [Aspergillus carlsbadensis]|nr:SAGA complex component [Aspergillus carlsbadensis]
MEPANGSVPWSVKRLPEAAPPTSREQNDGDAKSSPGAPADTPLIAPAPNTQLATEGPRQPEASESNSQSPPPGVPIPHDLRTGAARGTRSANSHHFETSFEWDAIAIEKRRPLEEATTAAESNPGHWPKVVVPVPKPSSQKMSRNRPRGPPVPRDNGANEETDMWNKILQDLRKAKEKNDKQKALADQIAALNEKIGKDGGKPTLSEHNQLDGLYRQMLKLCEEERAILQDEPSDVIKNLGLLNALRQASEAEAPQSRAASLSKSRKKRNDMDGSATDSPGPSGGLSDKAGRSKGATQRSTSVSSTHVRDNVQVKIEEGAEGAKGTPAERNGQLAVGAEVVFKHNKNKQGVEGEGIQCIIKGITGEGYKKRYDVQDPEPNENGEQGAVYKTTAASLIPIPRMGSTLPSFAVGKQVLARYPDTTTFYRAEVMGLKKDTYRLKFEGEEDDKEMEVDRRFVLDIAGK